MLRFFTIIWKKLLMQSDHNAQISEIVIPILAGDWNSNKLK